MIAEMQPGSVVKIEIDPTVTDPSEIGYVDYERNMIHVGPTALVTEDQITYTSRRGDQYRKFDKRPGVLCDYRPG